MSAAAPRARPAATPCSNMSPATSTSRSNSSRPRPRRWSRRSGSRCRRSRRSRRASSRSPMAPADRPASAPTRRSSGSRARPHLAAAAHLTCVEASRDEIDDVAREYWAAGVRHIVALRGDPPEPGKRLRAASRRLCQCRRAGRGAEEGRAVRNLGRRLPRMPSGFAGQARRPRQSQAQDRRRRRPRDHPILLLARLLLPLPRRRRRGGDRRRDRAGHPAGVERRADPQVRGDVRRGDPGLDGPAVRRARRSARRAPARRRDGRRRTVRPALCGRRPPLPFLHVEPRRARLRDLPPARPAAQDQAQEQAA